MTHANYRKGDDMKIEQGMVYENRGGQRRLVLMAGPGRTGTVRFERVASASGARPFKVGETRSCQRASFEKWAVRLVSARRRRSTT